MEISKINGPTSLADTTLYMCESVDAWFEADGAIPVGSAVMLKASNPTGKLVVALTANSATTDHLAIGAYTGIGGSGALTTVPGLSGKAAVDGDIIKLRVYGIAEMLVSGATDVVAGDPLTFHGTTDGVLIQGTTTAEAGIRHPFVAMEAQTIAIDVGDGTFNSTAVFVRCM